MDPLSRPPSCEAPRQPTIYELNKTELNNGFISNFLSTDFYNEIKKIIWSCGLMHHVLDWEVGGSNVKSQRRLDLTCPFNYPCSKSNLNFSCTFLSYQCNRVTS